MRRIKVIYQRKKRTRLLQDKNARTCDLCGKEYHFRSISRHRFTDHGIPYPRQIRMAQAAMDARRARESSALVDAIVANAPSRPEKRKNSRSPSASCGSQRQLDAALAETSSSLHDESAAAVVGLARSARRSFGEPLLSALVTDDGTSDVEIVSYEKDQDGGPPTAGQRPPDDPPSTLSTQREPPVTGVVTPQATAPAPSTSVSAEATANPEGKASRAKKKRTTVNSNVRHTQLSADAKKAPTIKGPDANLLWRVMRSYEDLDIQQIVDELAEIYGWTPVDKEFAKLKMTYLEMGRKSTIDELIADSRDQTTAAVEWVNRRAVRSLGPFAQ